MKTQIKPTRAHARKILSLLSHGLVKGQGDPEPGKMCVEAAVCFAMGLPHSDEPPCVGSAVRSFKIALNDSEWSSNTARADGMRRIAIAQLGSAELDQREFSRLLSIETIRVIVPYALREAAKKAVNRGHREALTASALACESSPSLENCEKAREAAKAAWEAAWEEEWEAWEAAKAAKAAWEAWEAWEAADQAADQAAVRAAAWAAVADKDKPLQLIAECAVQVLIKMKCPGTKWLDLCPLEQ